MAGSRRAFIVAAASTGAGLVAGSAAAAATAAPRRRLELLSTYVAGSHRHGAPDAPGLAAGARLRLRREPANRYDARAVAIWTGDGQRKLGYVPRIHNQALANLLDAGVAAEARITGVGGQPDRPDIAVSVSIEAPLLARDA